MDSASDTNARIGQPEDLLLTVAERTLSLRALHHCRFSLLLWFYLFSLFIVAWHPSHVMLTLSSLGNATAGRKCWLPSMQHVG